MEETEHVRVLRKRPLAARDDSFVEEEDSTVHHLVPIPEYLRQVKHKKAKTENHKKHGSSLRCRVCPKPAPPAYYCCSTCSNANGCKPFAVCGAKSGRNCANVHAVTVHNI